MKHIANCAICCFLVNNLAYWNTVAKAVFFAEVSKTVLDKLVMTIKKKAEVYP
ncbi:hypothetical protein [Desulfosporosinus fructosivorans]